MQVIFNPNIVLVFYLFNPTCVVSSENSGFVPFSANIEWKITQPFLELNFIFNLFDIEQCF